MHAAQSLMRVASLSNQVLSYLVSFGRVVKSTSLDNELFIVVNAVAVNINFDDNLMLFAVADVIGFETEAVLVPQQSVNRRQHSGQFPFKSDRVIHAASFARKRLECVLCLQECHSARRAGQSICRPQTIFILLEEKVAGTDYIDWHARVLGYLPRLSIVNSAEGVDT